MPNWILYIWAGCMIFLAMLLMIAATADGWLIMYRWAFG